MARVSPLDTCTVHQDVDIVAIIKNLFHQSLDVFPGGQVCRIDRNFASKA